MQKKKRHSKFKNTGLLFELLTRQVTADILAGKDVSISKSLLFKYFKENTELGKEWQLYHMLINERISDVPHAERFLSIIIENRKKLSQKTLSSEKYNLIKEISVNYPIEDFLKSNIRNYKAMASVYKLFEDVSDTTTKFTVNEIYQSKNFLIEHITGKSNLIKKEEDNILEYYKKQTEDIRLLSYKLLIENFNKKYDGLDDDQKLVLREYLHNISNTNFILDFVKKKADAIKVKLSESMVYIDDNVVKIKVKEVINQMEKLKESVSIKDNQMNVLLLGYELVKEIKKVIGDKKVV